MKAGGLNTISLYIFWGLLEPQPGHFDFSGRNDIRRFVEICHRHGLHVTLRCGPFCNAEFLIGGLPVWLYSQPLLERSNDPRYLKLVARYYNQVGKQLKGLFWPEGGPIILVQLENELSIGGDSWNSVFQYGASGGYTGPKGPGYALEYENLRKLAVAAGINGAFYTMTGWGPGGAYPPTVFPTYGAYMYLGPPGQHNSVLTTFNVGVPVRGKTPIMYCELGTGSPARTNYRPMPPPQGCLTTAFVYVAGTETIAAGYYLYHGGLNPMNPIYGFVPKFNGLPLISYDFWAPISEFGQLRELYRLMRPLNYFLLNFGAQLADMEVRRAVGDPDNPQADKLRVAARANRDSGFVFISNFGDVHQLSARKNASILVQTGKGDIRIPPGGGLNIPSGVSGIILPFNLDLGGGVTLVSATTQPLFHMTHAGERWLVFFQPYDFKAQYVIARGGLSRMQVKGGRYKANAKEYICEVQPSRGSNIQMTPQQGGRINILTLSGHDALHAVSDVVAGQQRVLIFDQALITRPTEVQLYAQATTTMTMAVFPDFASARAADAATLKKSTDGLFGLYQLSTAPKTVQAHVTAVGGDKHIVNVPRSQFADLSDIVMTLTYSGDVCRIFDISAGKLVADNL
jgi:beta-galactosidase